MSDAFWFYLLLGIGFLINGVIPDDDDEEWWEFWDYFDYSEEEK